MQLEPVFKTDKWPILIAGPCSAETEEQLIQTARGLADMKIDLFRSGVWKPRTRPNAFEGVGEQALPWLQRVQKEFGFKVCTEVANTAHVDMCLKAGIDVLWIGARTTVNPFSVQEIANALTGTNIPVLVKNPVSPDLSLWLGAIERLYNAGIKKIAVVHRGFSTLEKTRYRNKPQWEIALELKRHLPDIQLIVDPSHICGNKENLQHISQKALDLNYDGIMLETHIDPENAWSDAEQQVKPLQFKNIIDSLILRNKFSKDLAFLENLKQLRTQIDQIDIDLIHLLSDRMLISEHIACLKKENNISIFQHERWNEVISHSIEEAQKVGLSEAFVHKLLNAIHEESINHQDIVMNIQKKDRNI